MSTNQIPEKQFRPPEPGTTIAVKGKGYIIGEVIGSGYFGTIYACTDDWGNRLVAKVLLPKDRTYHQVAESWFQELSNLVALRHPNITYVYDAFEFNDTFYLIIERCDHSLDDLIAASHPNPELWLEPLARCVLQALHYIHTSGYIHKDLHPGNVFTSYTFDEINPRKDPTMHFKIGDLGISRVLANVNLHTTIFAKWMLPPEALDPHTFGVMNWTVDIYHAGLLFLSLLLGCAPTFTHEQILHGVPRQTAANLDSPYGPAIARALQRHVHTRPQTALEFWRDLVQCGGGTWLDVG